MPKNRLIYVGVLVIAAVALIFLAQKLTQFISFILPWALGVGVLLVLIGVFWEAKMNKAAPALSPSSPAPQTVEAHSESKSSV